jgi:hypothetical protein
MPEGSAAHEPFLPEAQAFEGLLLGDVALVARFLGSL